jgi:3-dehydroquinate synthetase
MLKHGAIADADYFARVEALRSTPPADVIVRSIEIKAAVVNEDPRESGRRKILNFGHTLGHAIETLSAYEVSHGEAVAIGMVLESRLGEALGVTARGTAAAMQRAVEAANLPATTALDPSSIVALTRSDKKVRGGRVEYALPASIGSFERWTTPVDDERVLEVLRGG